MRISDWSSDVCSSDLFRKRRREEIEIKRSGRGFLFSGDDREAAAEKRLVKFSRCQRYLSACVPDHKERQHIASAGEGAAPSRLVGGLKLQIGRASCRERVGPYV